MRGEKNIEANADRLDTLNCISCACETAVSILNDLLIVDKIDSGALTLKKQEIPIAPFIISCTDIFSPTAKEKGIKLSTFLFQESDSNCWPIGAIPIGNADCIDIDSFKLNQVIRNVISNALKFSMTGGSVTLKAFMIEKFNSPKMISYDVFKNMSSKSRFFDSGKEEDDSSKNKSPRTCIGLRDGRDGFLRIQIIDTGVGIDIDSQKRMFIEIFQFDPEFLQGIF